ncbi:hypothetical protein [Bradyrhizobium sp. S3.9.1]|uniref:hypothetical protein n=1 Tax=Bradyrhizobium sp. S3.9.1 TaxID=3156431 RepID=UPI0033956F6D
MAIIPILIFGLVDAAYLGSERAYRDLHNSTVVKIRHRSYTRANCFCLAPPDIEPEDGDTIKLAQIKEKHGTLRIYWEGSVSARAQTEIERLIELACARSACACEICGEEGRLYRRGDWLATACSLHAKGEPVPLKPGLENVYIVRGMAEENVGILSCRLYDLKTDSFIEIDPDSLGVN